MNTPTHAALNFLLLARTPGSPRALVVFAAILPDLPIFVFAIVARLVFDQAWGKIWREIYFRPEWQMLFDAFHSIPIFGALALWFRRRGSRNGQLFASSVVARIRSSTGRLTWRTRTRTFGRSGASRSMA